MAVASLTNIYHVRIEWGDCDPAGIIFYPRYFDIFDAATTALFERALGMGKLQQLKTFAIVGYPLVKTRAKFMKPTRCGDAVTVESRIDINRSSFEVTHRLSLDGVVCVEGSETRVWAVRDGNGALKAQAVPDEVRRKFGV
jgi:4-hydroxybenzoyl-CoA thioesterase